MITTAHAQKSGAIFHFFQELSNKKIKALRPKMTKIASRGSCLKCEFALSSIKFLGHIVSGTSLKPEKLTVVQNWKTPTSVTDVRQFFRRFIDHYSFIARPLEELTGKYACFSWSKQCHDAFAHLKESLTSALVLRLPDVESEFRLITDASDSAVAGVLLQRDDDKEWHPVAYTSRRLRP